MPACRPQILRKLVQLVDLENASARYGAFAKAPTKSDTRGSSAHSTGPAALGIECGFTANSQVRTGGDDRA